MQFSSRYLFVPFWSADATWNKNLSVEGGESVGRESNTETMGKLRVALKQHGLDETVIRIAKELLLKLDPNKHPYEFRSVFHILVYAYLENNYLPEIEKLLRRYHDWLEQHLPDKIYIQITLEYFRRNWLMVVHLADQFDAQIGPAPVKVASESAEKHEIYPCDVWIKGYIGAVFIQKPRKATYYLDKFSNDRLFNKKAALNILQAIQDSGYLFVSQFLRKIWSRFLDENFILKLFTIYPTDQLHDHEKDFLIAKLLPAVRKKPSLKGGKLLMHLGKFKEAGDILSRITRKGEVMIEAQFLAAQAYLETGDFEKAKSILEEVVKADPTHQQARLLLDVLNPMVGEVYSISADGDEEEHELLQTALKACKRYIDHDQEGLAIFLLKNIYQMVVTDAEDFVFEMGRLPEYFDTLQEHFQKAGRQKLAQELNELKMTFFEKCKDDIKSV